MQSLNRTRGTFAVVVAALKHAAGWSHFRKSGNPCPQYIIENGLWARMALGSSLDQFPQQEGKKAFRLEKILILQPRGEQGCYLSKLQVIKSDLATCEFSRGRDTNHITVLCLSFPICWRTEKLSSKWILEAPMQHRMCLQAGQQKGLLNMKTQNGIWCKMHVLKFNRPWCLRKARGKGIAMPPLLWRKTLRSFWRRVQLIYGTLTHITEQSLSATRAQEERCDAPWATKQFSQLMAFPCSYFCQVCHWHLTIIT